MSNDAEDGRIEALEKRVSEMEATIRGLTEELVDANTRIRDLEDAQGMHEPMDRVEHRTIGRNGDDAGESGESSADGAEASKDDATNEEAESEETGVGDDIIVA